MSSDQLAVAQLNLAQWQLWITGLAIFLGPLAGVLFSLWFQRRKERKDAKLELFLVLMSGRKSVVTAQVTQALNKIDVVFSDSVVVKKLWHEYYQILHEPPGEQRVHKWLELLAAMSIDLGKNFSGKWRNNGLVFWKILSAL